MATATYTAAEPDPMRRFDRAAWLVLALAIGYIVACVASVLLAFQQPTDGWLYGAGLGGNNILVANQSATPSPLRAGDALLMIDGLEIVALDYRPIPPSPDRRVGGLARYTVQRAGAQLELVVPLVTRPSSALLAYFWGGNDGSPWRFIQTVSWYLIGFAVFLLRPRSTAARLLLLIVVSWTTYDAILSADTPASIGFYPPALFWFRFATELLWPLLFAMVTHLVLAFPVRSRLLARWPYVTLGALYVLPTLIVLVGVVLASDTVGLASLFLTMAVLVVALIATTIANLRAANDLVVRAQIGWMAFGVSAPVISAVVLQIALFLNLVTPEQMPDWMWGAPALALPICLGIAITRYRLFDIAGIIRRTLVYSMLTLTLGAIYFIGVVALQALFVRLTGQESALAVVASTLGIAALFGPLRRWVQQLIDRRFYRRKYDAAKVLEAFALRAQQQADLDALAADIVGVVQEALEPETVAVWLVQTRQSSTTSPAKSA